MDEDHQAAKQEYRYKYSGQTHTQAEAGGQCKFVSQHASENQSDTQQEKFE